MRVVAALAIVCAACGGTERPVAVLAGAPPMAAPRASPTSAPADGRSPHERLVERVASPADTRFRERISRRGLVVVDAADRGDQPAADAGQVRLHVRYRDGRGIDRTAALPAVRVPSRLERTVTVGAGRVYFLAGNHRPGGMLRPVRLLDVLQDAVAFASSTSGLVAARDLSAPQDAKVVVHAQSSLVPAPRGEAAEIEPVVVRDAAVDAPVLVVALSDRGTGMAVAQEGEHAVPLDAGGRLVPFTAERRADVLARVMAAGGRAPRTQLPDDTGGCLVVVQIPLQEASTSRSDEPLARDTDAPIHLTVQHYLLTSTGVPSEPDLDAMTAAVAHVYERVERTGALVVGGVDPPPGEGG